jgi:hypothetical protein
MAAGAGFTQCPVFLSLGTYWLQASWCSPISVHWKSPGLSASLSQSLLLPRRTPHWTQETDVWRHEDVFGRLIRGMNEWLGRYHWQVLLLSQGRQRCRHFLLELSGMSIFSKLGHRVLYCRFGLRLGSYEVWRYNFVRFPSLLYWVELLFLEDFTLSKDGHPRIVHSSNEDEDSCSAPMNASAETHIL